jgi:hypothetical protein
MTPPTWGTPILLQVVFVLPLPHCDSPALRDGGVMVPIPDPLVNYLQ